MTSSPSKNPANSHEYKLANVLFVEDSQADIVLTKAIMKKQNIHFDVRFLRDGDEAVDFLNSDDSFGDDIHLIFMDFNLPKRNGLEVLEFVKNHKDLNHIPVIMLSGSNEPSDMQQAKELGAESYIIKPLHEDHLEKAVENIKSLRFTRKDNDKYLYSTI